MGGIEAQIMTKAAARLMRICGRSSKRVQARSGAPLFEIGVHTVKKDQKKKNKSDRTPENEFGIEKSRYIRLIFDPVDDHAARFHFAQNRCLPSLRYHRCECFRKVAAVARRFRVDHFTESKGVELFAVGGDQLNQRAAENGSEHPNQGDDGGAFSIQISIKI